MLHKRIGNAVTGIGLVILLSATVNARQAQTTTKPPSADQPTTLAFNEFFEPSTQGLKPSRKLIGLQHKRVKLTGFMAQMESELEGAFFLVPRPIFSDEEGGGNADIPPEAVLVIVPFRLHENIPFVQGLLEVTGVIEVGNKEENGRVSSIRLIMDAPNSREHR